MEWLDNKICDREYGGIGMKFRIHYKVNGYEDSVIIEGDRIEEIREKAYAFTDERGAAREDCWSERVD